MKSNLFAIACALIIGFLGGVGTIHTTISSTVATHTTEIIGIKERISGILQVWSSESAERKEIITLVREQNALVREQNTIMHDLYISRKAP
jgi:hypothetical protein